MRRLALVSRALSKGENTGLMVLGYGLHYPIRHGQIENWVS